MVPRELKVIPQWVCWRLEERKGKETKVPYQAASTGWAKVDDPGTWSTCKAAWDSFSAGGVDGLGFVVTAGDPYCGIDLDHCRDADTQAIEPWAQAIVDRFKSYTEITPSQTGLRIWIKGQLPTEATKRHKTPWPEWSSESVVELYDRERYFTITGRQLAGSADTIEDRQAELDTFYQELFPPKAERVPAPPTGLTPYEVIQKASGAKNGPKFDRLMRGDLAGFPSGSEADMALASMVAFWNPSQSVVEQVVRMSGLWDEKWEREDYRVRTIERALANPSETYSPNGSANGHGEIRHGGQPAGSDIGSGNSTADVAKPETAANGRPEDGPWLTPLGTYLEGPPEQLDWLVDGLLINGGIGVFGAKPKVAKTTLLTQFTLSVARGVPFLGRPTKPGGGPVIYLALEEDRGRVVDRFRKLGATSADRIHIHVGQAGPDGFKKLGEAIRELGAVLAVIDPIQRLTRLENINDYSEVSNATDPLIAVARETGCAVVFSHHLGKTDRGSGDQLLGSTALFGSVDTAVVIRKREDDNARTLETVQRYGASLEPIVLGYNEETGSAWIAGPAEEYDRDRERVTVLRTIIEQVEPVSQKELLELLPMRWDRAIRALSSLVEDHSVQKFGGGAKGNPYRYIPLRKLEDLPTAFLNSNPIPFRHGNEPGNESGNESNSSVLPESPHGFPSLLKEVGQGILPPTANDPPVEPVSAPPPPAPTLAAVLPLRRTAYTPPADAGADMLRPLQLACPTCSSELWKAGPVGPPQRECLSCKAVWNP